MRKIIGEKMNYYNRNDILTIQEENERDMEYFKEFYPRSMQQIQEIIEDECDRLEYQGSRMFDEYPDRNMLRSLSHKIYDRVMDPQRPPQRPPFRPPHRPDRNNLLEDVIQVLLFNELARRRCRYRNCRYNIF